MKLIGSEEIMLMFSRIGIIEQGAPTIVATYANIIHLLILFSLKLTG